MNQSQRKYRKNDTYRKRMRKKAIKKGIVEGAAAILLIIAAFIFYNQNIATTAGDEGQAVSTVLNATTEDGKEVVAAADAEVAEATPDSEAIKEAEEEENITKQVSASASKLESKYVFLMKEDGTVLFDQDGEVEMNPASMTKLMTALVVVENVEDLSKKAEVTRETANYTYTNEASVAGFEVGEKATILQYLYGAMLPSGAECCLTLADYVAGSHVAFVEMMNEKAKELGMENTHFTNSVGLSEEKHYSTAKDMAILLKECMENDTLKEIMSKKLYTVEKTNIHKDGFTFYSTVYRKFTDLDLTGITLLGGKTGFTDEAGYCLATAAIIDDSEYFLVSAGAKTNVSGQDQQMIYKLIADIADKE